MTRQRMTAAVSTGLFVVLLAVVSLVPVPFVTRSPGDAVDLFSRTEDNEPVLSVTQVTTYPIEGHIELPSVAVTSQDGYVTLPQAFFAYLNPSEQVVRRQIVYPLGNPNTQIQADSPQSLENVERNAVIAALREANQTVMPHPVVSQISNSGPAYGKLQTGDLIYSINGTDVRQRSDVVATITAMDPGSVARLVVSRNHVFVTVDITTVADQDDPTMARIGIDTEDSYEHDANVSFKLDYQRVGSSAGLSLALAVYDTLTSESLTGGHSISAMGEVTASGEISTVSTAVQKVKSAERAGAEAMVVPSSNCSDLADVDTSMTLIRAGTLSEAIANLSVWRNSQGEVPTCQMT